VHFLVTLLRVQWPYLVALPLSVWVPTPVRVLVVAVCALVLSSGVHELGHALAYWWITGRYSPVILRYRYGIALAVRTPELAQSRIVAAAGPLLPLSVGALVLVPGFLASGWADVGVAAAMFCLHAFALFPGNDDGDRIWLLT
jgi:hypothetical protein